MSHPDKRCILHIGAHKTGTTAVQSYLKSYCSVHPEEHWHYPKALKWPADDSHNLLAVNLWETIKSNLKTTPEEAIRLLLSDLRFGQNLIISSEMLEKIPLSVNLPALKQVLKFIHDRGFCIEVVYTIRRQDAMINSIFKQWTRDYSVRYKGDPLKLAAEMVKGLLFSNIAEAWKALPYVNKVTLLPYSRNMATAFAEQIGFKHQEPSNFDLVRRNPSLDGNCLRFKHYTNRFGLSARLDSELLHFYKNTKLEMFRTKTKLTVFNPTEKAQYLNQFMDDWAKVEKAFQVDLSDWYKPDKESQDSVFTEFSASEARWALHAIQVENPQLAYELEPLLQCPRAILTK